ncbi:MAG TPA: RidA family protein [Thermoanaerobaculia bacterium]|nr:RidA family protein [Thermoanaerobaculia bacterium]
MGDRSGCFRRSGVGLAWEARFGYCRALRAGDRIVVSGTTATADDGTVVAPGDAAEQTRYVLAKIERALTELGASLDDVIRTRVFVRELADWQAVAEVHGEVFRGRPPANTLLRAEPIGEEHLVEIEAEAVAREAH